MKCWKLCSLSAHTQHHKNLWQNDLQVSYLYAESKENINKNNQLNILLHDKSDHYSSASELQNQEDINKHRNITKIVFVIYFLSLLCDRAAWDMQQHQQQTQCQWLYQQH